MKTAFLFNLILCAPVRFALVDAAVYKFVFVRLVVFERFLRDGRSCFFEPESEFRRLYFLVYVVIVVQPVEYLLPETFFVDSALQVDPVDVPVVKVALRAFDFFIFVRDELVVRASVE